MHFKILTTKCQHAYCLSKGLLQCHIKHTCLSVLIPRLLYLKEHQHSSECCDVTSLLGVRSYSTLLTS